MCTVTYTPTLRCTHQLRITINETDIPGSPLTVHVLPSAMMKHKISGLKRPWGVALSKSGELVVSEFNDHRVSVYTNEWKMIRSFGFYGSGKGQFQYPRSVATTSDNRILVADSENYRIQMFTMAGRFVKSVGEHGNERLQFKYPSGIAVHPSGKVFVADTDNHRIQVLNSDLSYSHMFGSKGKAPGQFSYPRDVAINSSGVVYAADYLNNRVQLFSADGQFISSFGSEWSRYPYNQLLFPIGICNDNSTNTVYITDEYQCDRLSAYTSSGKFIKRFSTQESLQIGLNYPKGVAVDNTTGALYVCDFGNDRIIEY